MRRGRRGFASHAGSRGFHQGSIKGRDLAVVVGILIDTVAMLEQRQEPPAANVAELMRRARDIAAITQELERRQREAINVTPAGVPTVR